MENWLTQKQACDVLGVQKQTLYAYVSRGLVGVRRDPQSPNRSQYRVDDVNALVHKRSRGRARNTIAASTMSWGEPIISTRISTIVRGQLYYRGREVVRLADTASLEQAAQLLWESADLPHFPVAQRPLPHVPGRLAAYVALGEAANAGLPTQALSVSSMLRESAMLVGVLASSFVDMKESEAPLHLRMAQAWNCTPHADLLRRALVLLADQELTSSAFAARVTASTGASLGASALAALAALSGPLHGDATLRVQAIIDDVHRSDPEQAVRRWISTGQALPGFGHHIYPLGDPRGADLLSRLEPSPQTSAPIRYVEETTGQKPTIDVALAALAEQCDLPAEAAFALFAIGRSVGWMAHVMEQITTGSLIRPRASYVGPEIVADR